MDIKNQAEEYLLHGQWEQAITAYDEALKGAPDDAELWNDQGVALYRLGRYEPAVQSYQKALQFSPANEIILNNLNQSLGRLAVAG